MNTNVVRTIDNSEQTIVKGKSRIASNHNQSRLLICKGHNSAQHGSGHKIRARIATNHNQNWLKVK